MAPKTKFVRTGDQRSSKVAPPPDLCERLKNEDKKLIIPDGVPARWQWHGAQKWHDYDPEASLKLEKIWLSGTEKKLKFVRFWDGGIMREVDLLQMRQLPGGRKLRRVGPPAPSTVSMGDKPDLTVKGLELKRVLAEDAAAKEKASLDYADDKAADKSHAKPKRLAAHSAPARPGARATAVQPAPSAVREASSALAKTSQPSKGKPSLPPKLEISSVSLTQRILDNNHFSNSSLHFNCIAAWRRLLHASFADMQPPEFAFVALPKKPQRKGAHIREELVSDIGVLAEEYSICLEEVKLLPVRGTPDEAFAAAAVALHMGGPYHDESSSQPEPTPSEASSNQSSGIWQLFNHFNPLASGSARFSFVGLPPAGKQPHAAGAAKRPHSAPAGGRRSVAVGGTFWTEATEPIPETVAAEFEAARIGGARRADPQVFPTGNPSKFEQTLKPGKSMPSKQDSSTQPTGPPPSKEGLALLPPKLVFSVGRESPDTRALATKMRDIWLKWTALIKAETGYANMEPVVGVGESRFEHTIEKGYVEYKNYEWVMQSNDIKRRMDRMHCTMVTLWHASKLRSTDDIMNQTKLLRYNDKGVKRRPKSAVKYRSVHEMRIPAFQPLVIGKTPYTALEQVVRNTMENRRTAAVVICNPIKVGGDLFSGLVPGEEEEACMRSTFFLSMLEAQRQAKLLNLEDILGATTHIPDDGAVQCKNVLILRENGPSQGYAPFRKPVEVPAVFAITVPQKAVDSGSAILLIRKKIDTILRNLQDMEVDCLVISDNGAGHAAETFAKAVGGALGLALVSKEATPKEVICAGSFDFYKVVKDLDTNMGW